MTGLELHDLLEVELQGVLQSVRGAVAGAGTTPGQVDGRALEDAVATLQLLVGLVAAQRDGRARGTGLPHRPSASFGIVRADGSLVAARRAPGRADEAVIDAAVEGSFWESRWTDPAVLREHLDRALAAGHDETVVEVLRDDGTRMSRTLSTVRVNTAAEPLLVICGTAASEGVPAADAADVFAALVREAVAIDAQLARLLEAPDVTPEQLRIITVRVVELNDALMGRAAGPVGPDPEALHRARRALRGALTSWGRLRARLEQGG